MKDAFVSHPAFALGALTYSVEASRDAGRFFSAGGQFREAGFAVHRVCSKEQTAYSLAQEAVAQLRPHLAGVDAIIYATCLPLNGNLGDAQRFEQTRDVKHLMDFPASHLQADFHLDNASVLGLNQQACTSMIGSMRLARALIVSEPDVRKVLCVSADRFPEGAKYEQAYNVISDGAAACLVSDVSEGYRIVASHALTNGALARANDDETAGSYFSYTHRLVEEVLAKAKLPLDALSWVVPQNTNVNAWAILSRLLRIDLERVFFASIGEVGHIISSDNIVNLSLLEQSGRVKSGDKLLLLMAGFGLNWQAIVLEKV